MKQRTYKRLKNFSTSISIEKTISEIEKMLSAFGASKIMKEYDEFGIPFRLSFIMHTQKGEIPVKLPTNVQKIKEVFKFQVSEGYLPKKFWETEWSNEQAGRVAWRIIKDWLDAQLTLLGIEMVRIEELFLPYIYNAKLGKTMFELIEQNGFNIEQLGYAPNNDTKTYKPAKLVDGDEKA